MKDKLSGGLVRNQVAVELDVLGYFKLVFDASNRLVQSSGGLVINGSGSVTIGQTFMAGPVPCFLELELGAEFEIEGELGFKMINDSWMPDVSLKATLQIPIIKPTVGVGVCGVAEFGLQGTAVLEMVLPPNWAGTLSASLAVHIEVMFLGEFNWQIGNGWSKQLWPKEETGGGSGGGHGGGGGHALKQLRVLNADDAELTAISDDYLAKTTAWNRAGPILQEWILPNTVPDLVTVGDRTLLLFQANAGKTGEHNVTLMYSVLDHGVWSEPKAVYDDGTNDLLYHTLVADNELYVVWQNLSSPLEGTELAQLLEETASKTEVFVAKWNAANGRFEEAANVSNNSTLDMLPTVAIRQDTAAAAWVHSDDNAYLNGSSYTIDAATSDGTKWTTWRIAEVNGYVSELAIGYCGDQLTALYCSDGVLYAVTDGVTEELSSADANISGITFVDGRFFWTQEGVVYAYVPGSVPAAVTESNSVIGSGYRLLANGEKTAFVWATNDDTECVLYASMLNDGKWSSPIRLYSRENNTISYFDAELAADGTWKLAADCVSAEGDENKTSLLYEQIDPLYDIALDYAAADETKREGNVQPVNYAVVNLGESPLKQFELTIQGDQIHQRKTVTCSILPGETQSFTTELDVSGIEQQTKLTALIEADNDSDVENNAAEFDIGLTDVSTELEYSYSGDNVYITAHVRNEGSTVAHAVISVMENDARGSLIAQEELGELAPGESVLYFFAVDKTCIEFSGEPSKHYLFAVNCTENEYNELNNEKMAVIYAPVSDIAIIPGPMVVEDPDSPTGYTVRFLYKNEQADSVTFAANIGLKNDADPSDNKEYSPFEYRPGLMRAGLFTAPMERRDDGLWYYEVPLTAGANQYWFCINGDQSNVEPDPENRPILSPGSSDNRTVYSVVYVPYNEKQDYKPLSALSAENPRGDTFGKWSYKPVEIDGKTRYMAVYLPYQYDRDRAEPYKSIYVLHGDGQDESDWMGIGSAQNILDNLIAEGRTEPAVLISLTSNDNMLGSMDDGYSNLFDEVIPYVEANYNVSADKMDRAIIGLSEGGMNTLGILNAAIDVEKFGYYGVFSCETSIKTDSPGIEYAHVLFGGGSADDSNPDAVQMQTLADQGIFCRYESVTGGHDFNTWSQLFRIMCEDYLWEPEAFGDNGLPVILDTAALRAAIAAAEAIDTSRYTEETAANLEAARSVARDALNANTQEAIDAAIILLNSAVEALVLKPPALDKTALVSAIDQAEALDQDAYTFTTFAAVLRALADAKDILAHAETQNEIERAAAALEEAIKALEEKPSFRFDDVTDANQYYYTPVYWAYYHNPQITKGTSDKLFSPNSGCTRAQVVTFLWRAAGEPEPTGTDNPFGDVRIDQYYYRAVLWAVEKGITTGTSATTFRPDQTCTRGQIVTFLWRYNKQPEPTKTDNPFTDVPAGQYYHKAVLWAVENGVTNGTSTDKFSPDSTCTRGQIVTFLYRDMK